MVSGSKSSKGRTIVETTQNSRRPQLAGEQENPTERLQEYDRALTSVHRRGWQRQEPKAHDQLRAREKERSPERSPRLNRGVSVQDAGSGLHSQSSITGRQHKERNYACQWRSWDVSTGTARAGQRRLRISASLTAVGNRKTLVIERSPFAQITVIFHQCPMSLNSILLEFQPQAGSRPAGRAHERSRLFRLGRSFGTLKGHRVMT